MEQKDLARLTTRELLRTYASILSELVSRGVVRSRNAPAGDLVEYIVAVAYGGELAAPSVKSWDVATTDGRRLQVKGRLLAAGDGRSHNFSMFRSWDFDACVFVILDAHSYDVVSAVEVPVDAVRALARESTWVRGFRISTRARLVAIAGATDVTDRVRTALESLDTPVS